MRNDNQKAARHNTTASLAAGSSPRELTDIEIASVVGGIGVTPPPIPDAGMYNVRGGLGGGGGGAMPLPPGHFPPLIF